MNGRGQVKGRHLLGEPRPDSGAKAGDPLAQGFDGGAVEAGDLAGREAAGEPEGREARPVKVPKKRHLEDNDGVDRRSSGVTVGLADQISDDSEVDRSDHQAKQVVRRDPVLKREVLEPLALKALSPHHEA